MRFLCVLVGHEKDRGRVWNDNLDYRGNCRRCGASMIRPIDRKWRLYDPAIDDDPARKQDRHEGLPID